MNKGYYSEGIAVVDRLSAYKHYFQNYLFFDIITAGALYANQSQSYYALIFLVRIFQMQEIFEKIDENFMLSQKFPIYFQLFQLLYQILLVAHICGCGFHFVGLYSDKDNNWIVKNQLDQAPFIDNYISSIYFAIIAMITVGFGDVVPINKYERVYVIFQTCFSCGIFAFAINTIGNIVKEKQAHTQELKANKNLVLTYMKVRNISKQSQNKVIRFLEYSHRNQNDNPQKGKQLIQNMSKSVRDEVYFEFFAKVINQIPLFTNYFSEKIRQEIQSQFSEAVYGPGDCILNQGKPSKNLYFIISGEIQQVIKLKQNSYSQQQKQIIVSILKQGDTFDNESFIGNTPCKYEYISKNTTQIAYIQKEVFENILQNYRLDYEQYCMLVHTIRFKNECALLKQCQSCKNKFHSILNCPLLHYEVNKELLLKRYICEIPQKRQDFDRQQKKRSNLKNFKQMHNQLRFFRLRLPKDYAYQSQNYDEEEQIQDIQQKNQFYQLLEYDDDEVFITCSPQLIFSESQNDIVYLIDEEEEETVMQDMIDDIENSGLFDENQSSQQNAIKRRNGLLISNKSQQEEQIKQKKSQQPKFNRSKTSKKQQNKKKQHKILNFAFSSDFKNYNKNSEFDKYDDQYNKNKQNMLPNKSSFGQLKSKSLTSLFNDQEDSIIDSTDFQEIKDSNINQQDQVVGDQIYSKTDIQKSYANNTVKKKQHEFCDEKKLSIQTQTQTLNIEDSQKTQYMQQQQQNMQQSLPIHKVTSEFQIPSNQQIQTGYVGTVETERIFSYQNIQNQQYSMCLSPLLEDQLIKSKPQNSMNQLPKVQINKNSPQFHLKNVNNQQTQINQQNQAIQSQTNNPHLLNLKNPQISPKRNSLSVIQGQQNINTTINSLPSSLNQKNQSRLSVLNELNPHQGSSSISNSQIKELSQYSKRSSQQYKPGLQYQQQQSLNGVFQGQQPSQTFIGNQNQTHNQFQSLAMLMSRQFSNFSQSNKTKKGNKLQTKLNSLMSQTKNEENQNYQQKLNKESLNEQSNCDENIQEDDKFETLFLIPQFENLLKLVENQGKSLQAIIQLRKEDLGIKESQIQKYLHNTSSNLQSQNYKQTKKKVLLNNLLKPANQNEQILTYLLGQLKQCIKIINFYTYFQYANLLQYNQLYLVNYLNYYLFHQLFQINQKISKIKQIQLENQGILINFQTKFIE
ncbi:cyclic nucleotide-binding domain protein (macronuclear) [Tetrahymena thermophila SB210]|uniref:Cyclic nucleotide-binding domain protein n=1 Tax=Tetrahymena thermophila (strain SB210) TaxID=312017 RepID=Q23G57_TETTS|nr:cyclic nucleotide-binding domain protein [Tetrahymena thermophila SB210]EAR95403.2 cyclic nucleotide-binding domain protein [Tetrahymena thermophila SB210]|eukprot:XP_001015648.2 cyclic nucleotide-binding domain protein [Tetrahymena thermophila SB210]